MLNSLRSTTSCIYVIFLLVGAIPCQATTYTFSINSSSTAEVSFDLGSKFSHPMPLESKFLFAIPTHPSVDISIQRKLHRGNNLKKLTLTPLSRGWMGKYYLQWYSCTYTTQSSTKKIDEGQKCTLSLSYGRPILLTTSSNNQPVQSGPIVQLPIKKGTTHKQRVSIPSIPYTSGVRMSIPQDGIYQISGQQLKLLGVPLSQIATNQFRLFCRDKEIPLYISNNHKKYIDENDYILFYGTTLRGTNHYYTQYANNNTYWLTWDNGFVGARVAEPAGWFNLDPFSYDPFSNSPPLVAGSFTDTLHIEQDNHILWQGDIYNTEEAGDLPAGDSEIDSWYWGIIGKKKLSNYSFSLPSPRSSTVKNAVIRIMLSGLTNLSANPKDHQFSIQLNNQSINSPAAIWDGQKDHLFVSNLIEANKLKHGVNTLTFSRLQDDNTPDRGAFNWIEVLYLKGFMALDNRAFFRNNAENINRWTQFNITGFSTDNIELWDIGKFRKFHNYKVEKVAGAYNLSFQDSITGFTRYYAQAEDLRLTPSDMVLDTIFKEWQFSEKLDYLMITTTPMIPPLQPLADYHTSKGLAVAIIDIRDIYNCFSYGITNPESIRTFLRYLLSKQQGSPPRFLLFGGDASHDLYKAHQEKTVVPTHLTRVPNWGPSSDDGYFATIVGSDNFSDIAVGRLPARDINEMHIMVQKTLDYHTNPQVGFWRDNIILAGGVETDFTSFNNEVVSTVIGPHMNIIRMDGDPQSPYYTSSLVASDKMAQYINAGAYVINFTGHGGGNTWSDSKFFSYADLAKLHNSQWGKSGRLPIVFSFTCLTGFFESAFYESLGEEFLRESRNGCISFYGASGYTKRNIDIHMSRTLLTNAMNISNTTLGELIHLTETEMLVEHTSEALPLIRQYNLLGDPALLWQLPDPSLTINLKEVTINSDTVKVSGLASPITSGSVKLSLFADFTSSWGEIIKPVTNSTFSHNFILKPGTQTAKGLLRAFAWDDSIQNVGWHYFSKDTFALHNVSINPALPSIGDSITISCEIHSRDTQYIPTVQCRYTIVNPITQPIVFNDTAVVSIVRDTISGIWHSKGPIILSLHDTIYDINKQLVLKFFATGNLGASEHYFFPIKGKVDLTFTSDTLPLLWNKGTLTASTEILNIGNIQSPPFRVIAYSKEGMLARDTIFSHTSTGSLDPGKVYTVNIPLPDTQGTITYFCDINPSMIIPEISYSNNQSLCPTSISYADLHSNSDTLFSLDMGCRIIPVDSLLSKSRIFLLTKPIAQKKPLFSNSQWVPLQKDSLYSYYIHSKPPLTSKDSLQWFLKPTNPLSFMTTLADTGQQAGIFKQDSSFYWHNQGGVLNKTDTTFTFKSNELGPYALGTFADNSPPEIQVFVGGKEILYLDYAAKNKPFTIFIFDSSGIDSSFTKVLHNGSPLDKTHNSSLIPSASPSTATLTAYPPKMNEVDSITIITQDLAGNRAQKSFAYKPGENLSIRFFSCHPNPFSGKPGKFIRFAFLITDVADKVTLTVYTISGRKVWSVSNRSNIIGYQEIRWDGTTSNQRINNVGYRIANGTYYAKLVVSNSEKSVEKIIRIAKLEGY